MRFWNRHNFAKSVCKVAQTFNTVQCSSYCHIQRAYRIRCKKNISGSKWSPFWIFRKIKTASIHLTGLESVLQLMWEAAVWTVISSCWLRRRALNNASYINDLHIPSLGATTTVSRQNPHRHIRIKGLSTVAQHLNDGSCSFAHPTMKGSRTQETSC